MTLSQQLQSVVQAWVASGGDEQKEAAVHEILDSEAYRSERYTVRNAPWVTSTKLLALEADPFLCWLQYVKCEPPPVADESEALALGIAVDEWVTFGDDRFRDRYVAVARRDKKAEEGNPGKTLLTNGQMETVTNAVAEYRSRHFFPPALSKRNFLAIAYGLPLKAECDGFDASRNVIQDLKTTANLNTFADDFRPGKRFYEKYLFQLAYYSFVFEMGTGERVNSAELLVCDKYTWSRSHKWQITYPTLQAQFPRIEKLLTDWRTYSEASVWPFLLRLDTPEGLQKFNDSPFYSHPLLKPFKDQIPESIL